MDESISLKEAWEQLLSYDPAVWVGVFTAIIVFAIEIILHKKNIIFSGDDKRIAKAKAKRNVISATQVIETAPGEAAVGFRGSEDMGDLNNVANDWVGADIGLVNSTCTIDAVGDFVGDATEFVGDTIEYVGDAAGDFFEGAADVAEDVGDFLFGWIS